VRLPVEKAREMLFLSAAEVTQLAEAIGAHYRPLIYTAAYGGLRWGELAGLRVERVNFLRSSILVVEQMTELNGRLAFGPPKTNAGRRTVGIPAFLMEMLTQRVSELNLGPRDLMFPSPDGTPMRRSNFRRRAWVPAIAAVGFNPALRFHDLRHTAVALAIAQGTHPKAIQERMGHSSITVTLDRYGHLFPTLDENLATSLDELYRAALADSSRTLKGSKPQKKVNGGTS
jgi:integrase